jgi:hypothetical protein
VSTACLRAAELRDLAVIALWLAPALARHHATTTNTARRMQHS